MKFHRDYVVVKTDRLLIQEAEIDGYNGQKILMDASFHPERHVQNFGEAISVPNKLGKKPFALNAAGPPLYFEMNKDEIIWMDAIPITVEPGDRVYFHHNEVLDNMEEGVLKEETVDGKKYYYLKILYSQIFCSVRDGKIFPNATWTLIEPDMESWEDILHPVPEVDENGDPKFDLQKKYNEETNLFDLVPVPILKPQDQWIQMKVAPEHKTRLGFIRHIGPPLKGQPLDLEVGDHILYKTHADFEVEIERKKYFLIKQRHIEGKFV